MPLVASVRLRYASQDYWFDPAGLDVKAGDHVLVETSKGTEIGLCTHDVVDVEEVELAKPLKPVIRIATEEDLEKADEIAARDQEALAVFHDLADKNHLDMSPSAVEFSFDESHATFYFTSDDRVDFRGLVRDLAAEFHTRVDMRQIGPRDEARMLGGLGHCGEELCCARLGGEFQPVSIRMAKEQDLPLNPTKISGSVRQAHVLSTLRVRGIQGLQGPRPQEERPHRHAGGHGQGRRVRYATRDRASAYGGRLEPHASRFVP